MLDGFNEGINGLVLLFVKQLIQTLEIGLGRLAVFKAKLAEIQPGSQPAKDERQGQAQQNPGQVKVHRRIVARWQRPWAGDPAKVQLEVAGVGLGVDACAAKAPCPPHRRQRPG